MRTKNIVLSGAAATALGIAALVGTGTAFAAHPVTADTTTQTSSVQQSGNVQQGDQRTPDTGTSPR